MTGEVKSAQEHNGVYAFKSASRMLEAVRHGVQVWGKVALWGCVVEHELGWRAENAKVIELTDWINAEPKGGLEELRKRYGVERGSRSAAQ